MKKALVCIFCLSATVFTAVSVALLPQVTVIDRAELSVDQTLGLRVYKGQPFTGEARIYKQQQLVSSEYFVDGKRHGLYIKYFANGQVSYQAVFKDGLRHGEATSWWQNGNLMSKTPYTEGKMHGFAYQWYKTGEKFKLYHYENGETSGLQQAWRKNGELFSNFEYRNGRIFGLHKADLCVELEDENIVLASQ